ncbi:MAG: hypothetical protein AAGI36_19255 [Pseudomonadota bacterium]
MARAIPKRSKSALFLPEDHIFSEVSQGEKRAAFAQVKVFKAETGTIAKWLVGQSGFSFRRIHFRDFKKINVIQLAVFKILRSDMVPLPAFSLAIRPPPDAPVPGQGFGQNLVF